MNKYKLSMKTSTGLGTEYVYVESLYENFERYLKSHNLKYQKYDFKTNQDKEIERLNNIIKVKTDFIEELLKIIAVARDYELHDKVYTRGKIYEEKLNELKGDSSNE